MKGLIVTMPIMASITDMSKVIQGAIVVTILLLESSLQRKKVRFRMS